MKFCPNCGNKFNETDKFCAGCGSEKDNTYSSGILTSLHANSVKVENEIINPFDNINIKNNVNDIIKKDDIELQSYFSNNDKLFFGKEMPLIKLKKFVRDFEYSDQDNFKKLEHLLFYSSSSKNSFNAGWNHGFTLSRMNGQYYLIISSGKRLFNSSLTIKNPIITHQGFYEIYNSSEKSSFVKLSLIEVEDLETTNFFKKETKLQLFVDNQKENDAYNIENQTLAIEFIKLYDDLINGIKIKLPKGVVISEDEWKTIKVLNWKEKLWKTINRIFLIGFILIVLFFIVALILAEINN